MSHPNTKAPGTISWGLASSLLLAILGACTGDGATEREANPLGATCDIPALSAVAPISTPSTATTDVLSSGGGNFSQLMRDPVGAHCSESYGKIDGCFNLPNPPAPSIDRSLSTSLVGYQDGKATGFPDQGGERASASESLMRPELGDSQIMPFGRTSNDGRLLMTAPYRSWPGFYLFRPENVGYDQTIINKEQTPLSPQVGEMHALAWFNPADTGFTTTGGNPEVWNLIESLPDPLHSTMCENSSERIDAQVRTPYACRAKYGDVEYGRHSSAAQKENIGLCYDFTFLAAAQRNQTKAGPSEEHWELRSAPLTIFVRNPYGTHAGEWQGDDLPHSWIYPQRVAASLTPDEEGVITLPDFAAYDLGYLFPWNQIGSGNVDFQTLTMGPSMPIDREGTTVQVPSNCYSAPGVVDESGPAWCAFLWDQRRSSEFFLDLDQNATVDSSPSKLTKWNGRGKYAMFEAATEATGRLVFINFNIGLFYSVQSTDTPCAADGFKTWQPLSSMPIDPAAAEFPLARSSGGKPFRDPLGEAMPFGSLHRFAYQWLDREGKNLIVAQMNEQRDAYRNNGLERVVVNGKDAGRANPPGGQDQEIERHRDSMSSRAGHEIGVLGAWTSGKFVTLDNGLNLSDFGGGAAFGPDGNHYTHKYRLDLYRDKSVTFIPKSVQAIQSVEHMFGLFDALRPTMPFDVVWGVSSGNHRNSEIVFDDYMAKNALVVAHMNAPMTYDYTTTPGAVAKSAKPIMLDGFIATGDAQSEYPGYRFNTNNNSVVRARLQNAAGHSPIKSLVLRGGARVEPVALGGVLGKGVYLDGFNDFIDVGGYYGTQMPADYYAGIWVDLRDVEDEPDDRVLMHFSDNTYVGFVKNGKNWDFTAYAGGRKKLSLGSLIQNGTYHHIGLLSYLENGDRQLVVLVDGNRIGKLSFDGDKFSLQANFVGSASRVTIGSPYKQVRNFWDWLFGRVGRRGALGAWVDEFRLYKLEAGEEGVGSYFAEVACNQALGTLVAVEGVLPAALAQRVAAVDKASGEAHGRVCEQLAFASHGDPTDLPRQIKGDKLCVDKVHRNSADPRCLRASLHQLPVPVAELPRADEQANKFCLSCHDPKADAKGLKMEALAEIDVARWLDTRRQPLNPPATIALPGNICAPGSPLQNTWYGLFAAWGQSPAPSVFATDFVTDGQIPLSSGKMPSYMPPFFQPISH